nr:hypothetical protein [uncultured Helicobacter sp.]
MKNIAIIDCSETKIFKYFLESRHFNVVACVVFYEEDKQYCCEMGVKYALTLEEADFIQQMDNFSFDLINTYRHTQRKVEFGMMRALNSNMLIANKYYNALCWWDHIFSSHTIDCVFVDGIPHGYIPETILLDMATHNKIPTYCTYPLTPTYSSIMRFDIKQHIHVATPIAFEDITQHLFYVEKDWCNSEVISNILSHKKWKILVHKWGGAIALDILSAIRHPRLTVHMGFYKNMRLVEKIYSFYRLKEMKRFYAKHAVDIDEHQKYVFYAAHFEPEAGTSVIVDLQNQLSVIQMLSHSLPKGWKLYIKEHPHQYDINNVREHFFLINFQYFKDKSFYEEVLKYDNVVLIKADVSSQQLLQHAQAVATINGSIILESVNNAKPCITFDNAIMPITQSNLFNNIHIFSDIPRLQSFLKSIETHHFTFSVPNDALYKKLAQFYFYNSEPKVILESIIADMQPNKKNLA